MAELLFDKTRWSRMIKMIDLPDKYKKDANLGGFGFVRYEILNDLVKNFEIKKNSIKIKSIVHTGFNINLANVFYSDKKSVYVSYGPTHISRDGEYKSTFVFLEYLYKIFKIKENQEYVEMARQLLRDNREFIETDLEEKDMIIVTAACLCQYVYFAVLIAFPSNISDDYIKLFKKYGKQLIAKKQEGLRYVQLLVDPYQSHVEFINISVLYQFGVKIIPLSINDIRNIGHIRRSSYREIYIGQKIEQYVYNAICPFFPTIMEWAFFNIENLNVFSNSTTFNKFNKSKEYIKSLQYLYKSKQLDIKDSVEEVEHFLGMVQTPINWAEKQIILSPKCFMIISEFVGRTFMDLFEAHLKIKEGSYNERFGQYVTQRNPFINIDNFKAMFAYYFYAMHVLSMRIGVIHCDLHLNNITYRLRPYKHIDIFVVGGKEYHQRSAIYGYIIDFGRSTVHADDIRKEHEWDVELIEEQNIRVMRRFKKLMPEFAAKIYVDLEKAFKTNYSAVYKVMYAIDPLTLMRNFRSCCLKSLSFEVMDATDEIILFVEDFFREWLPRAIAGAAEKDIPFVGERIFSEFYKSGEISREDGFKIDGYYNSERIVKDENLIFNKERKSAAKVYKDIHDEVITEYDKKMQDL